MIFRQLFEPISCTYTYLLGCEETGQAILIDAVLPAWQRDLEVLNELGLKLACTLDTHIHADHITAARKLKQETGSRIAHPAYDNLACADTGLEEGKPFVLGSIRVDPLFTPGHTDGHHAYLLDGRVFTGDAPTLYRSVREKLFTPPEETLVYPAHDYQGRRISNIGQEKTRNPRLGGGKTLEQFVEIMRNLKLAYPKFIDYALPGNRECGACPTGVSDDLQEYCEQIGESLQG